MTISREWQLRQRPVGMPKLDDFQMVETPLKDPGDNEIRVRNTWLTVDPYMRGRMLDRESYVPPFQIGETLQGGAIGVVEASNHADFKVGDKVNSMAGWREGFVGDPAHALTNKLPEANLPDSAFLGVAGMPGLTAYAGLLRVGELKEGETVFVSGAAGAVGSLVCQIAKIKNCTVIGSAGSDEKCAWLKSLSVDHTINYKNHEGSAALAKALMEAAPTGVDVYFENVGGDHLEAAIEVMRPMGRLALCGMISQYNNVDAVPGPNNMIMAVGKQLKLEGFIVSTHIDMQPDFIRDMSNWIGSGQLKYEETIDEGIEATPSAFLKLFTGGNTGKMLIKL